MVLGVRLVVVVLAWVWLGLFAVNMLMKEASMSRHDRCRYYPTGLRHIGRERPILGDGQSGILKSSTTMSRQGRDVQAGPV